jgi:hypothetical protein
MRDFVRWAVVPGASFLARIVAYLLLALMRVAAGYPKSNQLLPVAKINTAKMSRRYWIPARPAQACAGIQ